MESIFYRLLRRIRREIHSRTLKMRDCFFTTFSSPLGSKAIFNKHFDFVNCQFIEQLTLNFPKFAEVLKLQAEDVLAHRFNLLGSGAVVVQHGITCKGLDQYIYKTPNSLFTENFHAWLTNNINMANRSKAIDVRSMVSESYIPIDWQLDFKSGYRWSEKTWYRDIRFGHLPGVDVKVPWELSRMQHLPSLAMAACFSAAGQTGFQSVAIYTTEFRNQILDFIATNPPRFGVNWSCPMDVAIRVANWLLAYDLIIASGQQLGDEFDELFASSIRSHARHIYSNLEWSPSVRGNHYIANIVGLLFASAYLPTDRESYKWLTFSVRELISEVEYQFHQDGSNFEGSVCYHRLSAEMVTWASALVQNLKLEKKAVLKKAIHSPVAYFFSNATSNSAISNSEFDYLNDLLPKCYWERLSRMAIFTDAMTRPDGLVVQFGDNDSGRFITLGSGEQMRAQNNPISPYWSLDHRGLISAIQAILGFDLGLQNSLSDPASSLLAGFQAKQRVYEGEDISHNIGDSEDKNYTEENWHKLKEKFKKSKENNRFTVRFNSCNSDLLSDIKFTSFRGMGVYVVRSSHLYMAVRCGEIGLMGLGGHAHCDQLGIEVVIDGITHASDPGTYIYTPLPNQRNIYRSATVHHVPRVVNKEPANLSKGVFDLRDCAPGDCLYFGQSGFIGSHMGYGSPVYRIIELFRNGVAVHDFSEYGLLIEDPTPVRVPFSQGYGNTITNYR